MNQEQDAAQPPAKIEIEEIPPGQAVEPPVADEPGKYGAAPRAPNSVWIPLFGKGFVSWQSDNPIAVLALIMLVVVLMALFLLALVSLVPGAPAWIGNVSNLLGQAALTIVGAIIGSAATKTRSD